MSGALRSSPVDLSRSPPARLFAGLTSVSCCAYLLLVLAVVALVRGREKACGRTLPRLRAVAILAVAALSLALAFWLKHWALALL